VTSWMELLTLFHGRLGLQILMEDVDLWEHVEKEILEPTKSTPLAAHQNKEAKVKRIILEPMKDHFISHISNKTSKNMFYSLVELSQNPCASQQMILKN
jgi:EAL domain-containing protein (putative c-di-GMP-specific phosphodiesterase class I)